MAGQPKPMYYTDKISHSKNRMTAERYISDTKEIVNASWSNFQYDGAAAFKPSGKSPLPPASTAKDLAAGRTQE
jgi:hypothetical protein